MNGVTTPAPELATNTSRWDAISSTRPNNSMTAAGSLVSAAIASTRRLPPARSRSVDAASSNASAPRAAITTLAPASTKRSAMP